MIPSSVLCVALGALVGLLGVRLGARQIVDRAAYAWALRAPHRQRARRPRRYRIRYADTAEGLTATLQRHVFLDHWETIVSRPDRGDETAAVLRQHAAADAGGASFRLT